MTVPKTAANQTEAAVDVVDAAPPPVAAGDEGVFAPVIFNCPDDPEMAIKLPDEIEVRVFFQGTILADSPGMVEALRAANEQQGGSRYIEGDPKFANDPLVCETCGWPWHSQRAFTRHTQVAHSNRRR